MKHLIIAIASAAAASSSFASPPTDCPTNEPCVCVCREIIPAVGETLAVAEKRLMTADLLRLLERYVTDVNKRDELRRETATNVDQVIKHVALLKADFSEADRSCFKRVASYFNC
jgi:hypothetical protein